MKITINTIVLPLVVVLFFYSCKSNEKNDHAKIEAKITERKKNIVKMHPVVFGGNRYIVNADFGLEKKVPLMVHGNSTDYFMITHEIAEKLNNGKPIEKLEEYGYSEKGKGKFYIKRCVIGIDTFSQGNATVFGWPEEAGKAAQGMIGTPFLLMNNVSVNFGKEELEIGIESTGKPDKKLLDQGYSYTNFQVDERFKVTMNVFFFDLEKEIPITIGTVADEYSLDHITFKDVVGNTLSGEVGHSPSDTEPLVYSNTEPIKFKIANKQFEIPYGRASMISNAEYNNVKQEDLSSFGIIGRDWMVKHSAIIDYANKLLYFK